MKQYKLKNASVEEVSPNKTNTSNGVQFKTADDSTAAVFPVNEIEREICSHIMQFNSHGLNPIPVKFLSSNYSVSTIRRHLKILKEKGFIFREGAVWKYNAEKFVDSTESTVFPVTPERAKELADALKIEVDGKNLKYNINDVDLNAYGITTFESLIFANVVAANINEEFFCGYFQALKTLEEKGYVKCVDGCWLPAFAEKYDEITKIKAISLVLSRYMFLPGKDVYERMIDFIFYYENVQAKFNLCDNCPYCEKDIDGLPDGCLVSFEQDKCRNRLLYLVKTGVIK